MIKPRYLIGQLLAYSAFAVTVGYLSHQPVYQQHPPTHALLKLSMTHPGQRVGDCHQRTAEELAKLAPNMRAKNSCGRERNPVRVEMEIDGKLVYAKTSNPGGLSKDGASLFYDSREIPAGEHTLKVRMRDSSRTEGFDHELAEAITLHPRQVFVVDFDEENKHLVFKPGNL